MIYRVKDTNMDWIYEKGIQRGTSIGFHCLEDIFSIKKGYPLFVLAAPTAGKTEFVFEMLINLSRFYGWKHCIYSPETGSPKEVYAELAAKYIGQDYMNTYNNQMDFNQKLLAEKWLEEHFVIIDAGERVTIEDHLSLIDSAEHDLGIKFDTTLIDPWNKVKHEKKGRRDDEYLEDILNEIVLNSKQNNRVNIITTHCRDQQLAKTKDGKFYYPPPTARDFAGGQVWFRMGFMMLGLWRPAAGMMDEDGRPYEANVLRIEVQKAKPNGVAIAGKYQRTAHLYYSPKHHKYYEYYGTSTRWAAKIREEIKQESAQVVI